MSNYHVELREKPAALTKGGHQGRCAAAGAGAVATADLMRLALGRGGGDRAVGCSR
jgi:hypothetical protein